MAALGHEENDFDFHSAIILEFGPRFFWDTLYTFNLTVIHRTLYCVYSAILCIQRGLAKSRVK